MYVYKCVRAYILGNHFPGFVRFLKSKGMLFQDRELGLDIGMGRVGLGLIIYVVYVQSNYRYGVQFDDIHTTHHLRCARAVRSDAMRVFLYVICEGWIIGKRGLFFWFASNSAT